MLGERKRFAEDLMDTILKPGITWKTYEQVYWFKSYLSHRKFKLNLNNFFPEPGQILCGVTQGSILGHFYSFYI